MKLIGNGSERILPEEVVRWNALNTDNQVDVPWKIIKALGRTSEIEIVKTDHEGAVLERQICEVLPDGDLNCVVKDDKYAE